MQLRKTTGLIQGWGINDLVVKRFDSEEEKIIHMDAYVKWAGMLKRVFSEKYLVKYPTYMGCSVTNEWRYFSDYKFWHCGQYTTALELDKDVLFMGNKIYSPDTCCFVPKYLNYSLLTKSGGRGDYPLGVGLVRDKRHPNWIPTKPYCAQVNDGLGRYVPLGHYKTITEAHEAWQRGKIEAIHNYMDRYEKESFYRADVAAAMLLRVDLLKQHIAQGIETTFL